MYGSPPPPVPRIAAPTAMSSSSASPTSLKAHPPEVEVSDRLDSDPRGVTGEVGDRHVVDVHDANSVALGTGRDRFLDRLRLGLLDRSRPGRTFERDDLVDLAADLCDCGTDGVGDREVLRLHELTCAGKCVPKQNRAAADDDHGNGIRTRLHSID